MNTSLLVATLLLAATAMGCSSGARAIPIPQVDAKAAARRAIELYDTDQDGFIAGAELDAAPPLKAGLRQLDADGDARVSQDEIANRIASWRESEIGMMTVKVRVTRSGNPVREAVVKLVPERYLGESFKAASGVTDVLGLAAPSISKADRPFPDAPPGVQLGLYKIEVTMLDGANSIPAKFNSSTTLGHEISTQDADLQDGVIEVALD